MSQRIREVMTSNPSTIEPDKSVVEAARIMKREDAGVVPVTENGRLTGMVTDRDIAIRVVAEGMDPQSTVGREVASKDLVTLVEEDGRLVGVLAQADLAREADDTQTGQVVQEISE